jgi:cell division protein FtsW (lipid II flippase)
MEYDMDQEQKLIQAHQRVAKLRGFYGHVATYVVFMTLLFFINFFSGGSWWFHWPLFGWGIAVALHALSVFGLDRVLGPEWEQNKIDEFMKRG